MFINKNNEYFIKEMAFVKKAYIGVLYDYIKPNTSIYRSGQLIPAYTCGSITIINDGSITNGFMLSFNVPSTPAKVVVIVKDKKIDDISFRFLSFIKFNDKNMAKYIKDMLEED